MNTVQANLAATLASLQTLKQNDSVAADRAVATERVPETIDAPAADPLQSAPGYTEIQDRPITSLTVDIQCPKGDRPADPAAAKFAPRPPVSLDTFAGRSWPGLLYEWEAPGLCHGPLYFEEENLERYGYTHRRNLVFQPVISGGRFFATVVAMPYMMSLRPPCECVYTLGYYRPGSCVPFQARLMELNAKAAAVQGAAVTGLIFAIP